MATTPPVKVALAQINATVGDLAGNARRIADAARSAHAQGARLVITPELGLCGYPPEYLLPPLPNTLYTRDTTCWIYGGVTLNPLYWPARHEETILTTSIYKFHPDFAGKVNV